MVLLSDFYKEEHVKDLVILNFRLYREESNENESPMVYYSKTAFIFCFFYSFMRPITGFGVILVYSK